MHVSGNLATMANGLPYAIAAQFAFPERQCVAFVGDFSMLMAEFATAVKYRLLTKVVILRNHTLGQIKRKQMVFLGNPEYGVELQPIDFRAGCSRVAVLDYTLEDASDCSRALQEFLNTPRPAGLQAIVDPFEPPMPGKVTAEQTLKFAECLASGEPNRAKIARTAVSNKIRKLI